MSVDDFKTEAGNRLRIFIATTKKNQSYFANNIGVKLPTLSRVLSKGGGMSAELIYSIIEKYPQLNWHWIFTGTGGMILGQGATTYQQGGINQSGTEGLQVAYNSGNNNGNQYTNSGQGKIVVAETELQSCKDMLEERDKLLDEKDKMIAELKATLDVTRKEKEVMQAEKDKFWKMLEKMME